MHIRQSNKIPLYVFSVVLLIGVALFYGINLYNTGIGEPANEVVIEKISITTTDGVGIVGDWYVPDYPNGSAVILLHMMNRDRASWKKFAGLLAYEGYGVLAIDMRGHGESVFQKNNDTKRVLDYREFSDEEHQSSMLDIEASVGFVDGQKNIPENRISLVGASIGANLALRFVGESKHVNRAVLLSPGLEYRGIRTPKLIKDLSEGKSIYMIAGSFDTYSSQSVRELSKQESAASIKTEILPNPKAGHGTDMLEIEAGLSEKILKWISGT